MSCCVVQEKCPQHAPKEEEKGEGAENRGRRRKKEKGEKKEVTATFPLIVDDHVRYSTTTDMHTSGILSV